MPVTLLVAARKQPMVLTVSRAIASAAVASVLNIGCLVVNAEAHDYWTRGAPISEWVKRQCCGPADAHHLQAFRVHVTPSGYKIDGYSQIIPETRLLQSPDGEWWVFYRNLETGEQSQVYCFFGPPQGS